ncbi:hypothetical protein [Clostridium sp. ZS1]|uniref:hypothetical protein n=1 Tax=Clostridium sp. ZS1 TaxID=2949989 RepID=UPI00207943BF|nr:hypothetical protein [Clostridium sp. ZS1]
MATKLYNSHLSKIIFQCNEYYILDTYISLAYISSEVNSKYLIQTFSDSKADLINLVRRNMSASYKTVFNSIDKLIDMCILSFHKELNGWVLVDMENMVKSKTDSNDESKINLTGYTNIRNFFFTEEFRKMKAREKRLIIYMAQLCDSKGSKFYHSFSMNLLKPNSSWMKVLKTKSKYYAKYTINKMFNKYKHIFNDNSYDMRIKDLSPKKTTNFKFYFKCPAIDNRVLEDEYIDLVKLSNPKEYDLVKEKIKFANITLTKKLVMHLIRAISNLKEWFLKDRVAQLIINKYIAIQIHKSRENIKSLPAYAAAVVKSVVNEYENFREIQKVNNIRKYEYGEYFIEYTKNKANNDVNYDVKRALILLE